MQGSISRLLVGYSGYGNRIKARTNRRLGSRNKSTLNKASTEVNLKPPVVEEKMSVDKNTNNKSSFQGSFRRSSKNPDMPVDGQSYVKNDSIHNKVD